MASLDKTGLTRLWEHIITRLSKKVDKVDGKTLTTNDFTDEDKEKLETRAPLIEVTSTNLIESALSGSPISVITQIVPKLENGDIAPSYDGGLFAPTTSLSLTVNDIEHSATFVETNIHGGQFNWTTGFGDKNYYVVRKATEFDIISSGVNSLGVNYIRLRVPVEKVFVVCNRYVHRPNGPWEDQVIRKDAGSTSIFIYDNNIDLENLNAILETVEFVFDEPPEGLLGELIIPETITNNDFTLLEENNTISSIFDTEFTYYVDTKRYIQNKIPEEYILPSAGVELGGVKSGGTATIEDGVIIQIGKAVTLSGNAGTLRMVNYETQYGFEESLTVTKEDGTNTTYSYNPLIDKTTGNLQIKTMSDAGTKWHNIYTHLNPPAANAIVDLKGYLDTYMENYTFILDGNY